MEAAGEKNLFEKDREVVGRGFDIRDLAAITAVEPADLLQDCCRTANKGRMNHLVLYRPGSGILHIVRNNGGTFSRIYAK
jgi:hypothetical protein